MANSDDVAQRMRGVGVTAWFYGCCAIAVFALTACASVEGPQYAGEWRVVDRATGLPIEGAALLFTYHGSSFAIVDSSSVCDYAVMATSDARGRFEWPASRWNRSTYMVPYKRGYVQPRPNQRMDETKREIYLELESRHDKLMYHYQVLLGGVRCASIGDKRQPIVDFLSIVLPDLRQIADSPSDKELLRAFEGAYAVNTLPIHK